MKKLMLIAFCCWVGLSNAQTLTDFNANRNSISKKGMITLGSWAIVNIGTGAAGWAVSDDKEWQSFHQMNLIWGAVNLGLAIPSYIGAARNDPSALDARKSYQAQTKKEKLFLVNTAFDFVYITSGVVMRERAKWDMTNQDRLNGWGNSFIIQGSFLFAFDLAMTLIHNRHRKKKFDPLINVSATPYGIGMRMTL